MIIKFLIGGAYIGGFIFSVALFVNLLIFSPWLLCKMHDRIYDYYEEKRRK